MANTIKVKSIWIQRGEGPIAETRKPQTVGSFAEADRILMGWSWTAPATGGYDKCDFKVTWEDGETYEGRYDLKHNKIEYPSLSRHITEFVRFHAGEWHPAHMTGEQYQKLMGQYDKEYGKDFAAGFKRLLDRYDLGGARVGAPRRVSISPERAARRKAYRETRHRRATPFSRGRSSRAGTIRRK